MAIETILIVEDEEILREFLAETLSRKNLTIKTASDGSQALKILKKESFDLILTDMKMAGATGLEILRFAKKTYPDSLVIVMTAFGSIENAVEAMRLGALNYLLKPFSPDTIEALIDKANEHQSLVEQNKNLKSAMSPDKPEMIAESPAMKKILAQALLAAKSQANIFVSGESGTGKEVMAHTIHFNSTRQANPFIKVNCAAIPETLIESEFFGHEKGAFTGATDRRQGRFEIAHQGTLLLDEITEVPLMLQPKLLRVIQEGEFERVGGTKPIKVDTRLISTSNRDIKQAVAENILREDLYYRLNVIPITLPPLRNRKEDIIPLANHFLKVTCATNHLPLKSLTKEAEKDLLNYPWPGNIRELSNIIERAVVLDSLTQIAPEHLFLEPASSYPLMTLAEIERKHILETLRTHNEDIKKAADTLGITLRKLQSKLKEYNV